MATVIRALDTDSINIIVVLGLRQLFRANSRFFSLSLVFRLHMQPLQTVRGRMRGECEDGVKPVWVLCRA